MNVGIRGSTNKGGAKKDVNWKMERNIQISTRRRT